MASQLLSGLSICGNTERLWDRRIDANLASSVTLNIIRSRKVGSLITNGIVQVQC